MRFIGNEEAMMLRSLNMLLEAVQNKGSMILVPSETPHLMNKAVSAALAKKTIQAGITDENISL